MKIDSVNCDTSKNPCSDDDSSSNDSYNNTNRNPDDLSCPSLFTGRPLVYRICTGLAGILSLTLKYLKSTKTFCILLSFPIKVTQNNPINNHTNNNNFNL